MHEKDQREESEDARGDADGGAAGQRHDLFADLGLGQLDLFTNQVRSLLGHLIDELADRLLGIRAVGIGLSHGYSGGSSLNIRR